MAAGAHLPSAAAGVCGPRWVTTPGTAHTPRARTQGAGSRVRGPLGFMLWPDWAWGSIICARVGLGVG
eukprot:5720651-Prymnesium_polylepis.2